MRVELMAGFALKGLCKQKENQRVPRHHLQILERMLAGFKLDIANMRWAGATEPEIDLMLDEFDNIYAHDNEGKLVIAVLRQAARPSYPQLSRIKFWDFRAVH